MVRVYLEFAALEFALLSCAPDRGVKEGREMSLPTTLERTVAASILPDAPNSAERYAKSSFSEIPLASTRMLGV
jgi:hypothetical protein